jgi:hypothetical protein
MNLTELQLLFVKRVSSQHSQILFGPSIIDVDKYNDNNVTLNAGT